jgi:hypothetical protein
MTMTSIFFPDHCSNATMATTNGISESDAVYIGDDALERLRLPDEESFGGAAGVEIVMQDAVAGSKANEDAFVNAHRELIDAGIAGSTYRVPNSWDEFLQSPTVVWIQERIRFTLLGRLVAVLAAIAVIVCVYIFYRNVNKFGIREWKAVASLAFIICACVFCIMF